MNAQKLLTFAVRTLPAAALSWIAPKKRTASTIREATFADS